MKKQQITNNLKAIRINTGLTQNEVARRLEFTTQNRISRWENGLAYPSIKNLLMLARLYRVNIEELYAIPYSEIV